jgi:hypothetical protein
VVNGYELFLVALEVYSDRTLPSTKYSIDVYLLRNGHPFPGSIPITINSIPYLLNFDRFFYVPNISPTYYSGVIDLDAFMSYCISQGLSNPNDIVDTVRMTGQMTTG